MSKIAGIDPGLASGGMVVIATGPDRVIEAYSLVEKKGRHAAAKSEARALAEPLDGWSDAEFSAAALRAEQWRDQFATALDQFEAEHGAIDFFAVESFVDQRSRAREEKNRLVKNRWQTPLVIGLLAAELEKRDISVRNQRLIYQNAGIVIRQWSAELAELKNRGKGSPDLVVPGDHKISNDHQRKALVHALALSLRLNNKDN
jgi:hypothetical protein